MKNQSLWLLVMSLCCMVMACTRAIDEEVAESDTKNVKSVQVVTRAESEVIYPLTLYAFDAETAELASVITATSSEEVLRLSLPSGKYHLVALGGTDECTLPAVPTREDVIAFPAVNRLSKPLQMGVADVQVSLNTTVSLTMYYQVASVDLALSDIPSDADRVRVTLSPLYGKLAFDGSYSGCVSSTVDLTQQADGTWTAPTFYTLPGASQQLTLSIAVSQSGNEQTYGYMCNGTLKSATPYLLSGSFGHGFSVNGVVSAAGWNAMEQIEFVFGTGSTSEEEPEEGDTEQPVNAFPAAGSIWNGHIVGAVENVTETSAELLLLSRDEWRNVPSAYNAEAPDAALAAVGEYAEEELTGWSIPTSDEAKTIRAAIGNTWLGDTNATLVANGLTPLSDNVTDDNGNNVRYLCESATRAFVWNVATSNAISKAGSKRTYYLRAVKRVKVELE